MAEGDEPTPRFFHLTVCEGDVVYVTLLNDDHKREYSYWLVARGRQHDHFQTDGTVLKDLEAAAADHGAEAGRNAAGWYYDRSEPTREDYERVLKGIEDGDPAILDTFANPDLSGQWADGLTVPEVLQDIGLPDLAPEDGEDLGQRLIDIWTSSWQTGYEQDVIRQTKLLLEVEPDED